MTIEHEPNCACETQNHQECENDDHEPGCTCGCAHYLTRIFLAKEQKKQANDPYRPKFPNILRFKRQKPYRGRDALAYYWTLKDKFGALIVDSTGTFDSKELAMRNCIAIFGKELWAGYHVVEDQKDWEQILAIGKEIEKSAKAGS